MTLSWTVAAQGAGCGLFGVLMVFLIRLKKKKPRAMTLQIALSVFLGCALVPSIPVLLLYPFVEPKPDLRDHSLYLCLAGFALAWGVYEAVRLGIK